jgi:hypothetical protein
MLTKNQLLKLAKHKPLRDIYLKQLLGDWELNQLLNSCIKENKLEVRTITILWNSGGFCNILSYCIPNKVYNKENKFTEDFLKLT